MLQDEQERRIARAGAWSNTAFLFELSNLAFKSHCPHETDSKCALQNLKTLDPSKLTPLTPEVISRQATINIGAPKQPVMIASVSLCNITGPTH